jgi:hypothetical protein
MKCKILNISTYVINYLNGIISDKDKKFNRRKWSNWKYYDLNGNLLKIEEFDD